MANKESKTELVDYQCLYTVGHQTTDLYLSYCGAQKCPDDHSYGPVTRDEYLIHFITKGKGYLQINNREYPLSPMQAFLIPPHIPTYYYADSTDPYSYVWVGFGGSKVSDYLAQTDLSSDCPVCDFNVPAEDFQELVEKILNAKELTLPNELQRVGYLYQILSLLIVSSQSTISGKVPLIYSTETYVEYALQYIEHHYQQTSVADIAKYVGINRSYLHSIFTKNFSMSPQEYLISYRLNIAKTLLVDTSSPITTIAAQVGYNDALTFSKAFKKQYGFSPTAYRGQIRQP